MLVAQRLQRESRRDRAEPEASLLIRLRSHEMNRTAVISKIVIADLLPDTTGSRHFESEAISRPLTSDVRQARAAIVTFTKGAKTHWQNHHGPQWLLFTTGSGEVSTRDGGTVLCGPLELVLVPPNISHRHGAIEGNETEHLALTSGTTVWEAPDPGDWSQADPACATCRSTFERGAGIRSEGSDVIG